MLETGMGECQVQSQPGLHIKTLLHKANESKEKSKNKQMQNP